MPAKRHALAIGLAAASVLTLAACEKPAPGVTVFAGTTSKHQEALCWAFDSPQLAPGSCAQDIITGAAQGERVAQVPVIPGQTVGISVDPVVADEGWYAAIGTQRLTPELVTSTYFRFTFPSLTTVPAEGLPLQIVAGNGTKTRGVWVFKLVPES